MARKQQLLYTTISSLLDSRLDCQCKKIATDTATAHTHVGLSLLRRLKWGEV